MIMIKKILKDKRVILVVLAVVLVAVAGGLQPAYDAAHPLAPAGKGPDRTLCAQLESTRMALETELIYAQSDEAVERWAREDAMMIQPGDIPIILLPPADPIPTAHR
jgi:hypothetical protein